MRDSAYKQRDKLLTLVESQADYICPVCNGYGGCDVGEMQNPGGTGWWEWKTCERCEGSGTITLYKLVAKKATGT